MRDPKMMVHESFALASPNAILFYMFSIWFLQYKTHTFHFHTVFLYRNATFLSGFSRIIDFPISGADLGDLVITRETCLILFFLYKTHTFHFYTVYLYRNATFLSGFSRIIVFPISGVDLGDPVPTCHAINLHSLGTRQTLSEF